MRFEGQVAAVTGGGSGIGAAICRRLAEEGAIVAALDVGMDGAQAVAAELPNAAAIYADVSDSASVDEALSERWRWTTSPASRRSSRSSRPRRPWDRWRHRSTRSCA
jgi:NADP-dependent 3-hydroxy acid dehydrogenase YdfG